MSTGGETCEDPLLQPHRCRYNLFICVCVCVCEKVWREGTDRREEHFLWRGPLSAAPWLRAVPERTDTGVWLLLYSCYHTVFKRVLQYCSQGFPRGRCGAAVVTTLWLLLSLSPEGSVQCHLWFPGVQCQSRHHHHSSEVKAFLTQTKITDWSLSVRQDWPGISLIKSSLSFLVIEGLTPLVCLCLQWCQRQKLHASLWSKWRGSRQSFWLCVLLDVELKYFLSLTPVSAVRNQWNWKDGRHEQEGAGPRWVMTSSIWVSVCVRMTSHITVFVCVCVCVHRGAGWKSSEASHSHRLSFHDQSHCRGVGVKRWIFCQQHTHVRESEQRRWPLPLCSSLCSSQAPPPWLQPAEAAWRWWMQVPRTAPLLFCL